MSDRDKDIEGELRLRLLEITEDPTFQGPRRKDHNSLIGGMIVVDAGEQHHESEVPGRGTIH
jgi:hypothetical protein